MCWCAFHKKKKEHIELQFGTFCTIAFQKQAIENRKQLKRSVCVCYSRTKKKGNIYTLNNKYSRDRKWHNRHNICMNCLHADCPLPVLRTFLAIGTDELAFGRMIANVRQQRRFARERLRAEATRSLLAE